MLHLELRHMRLVSAIAEVGNLTRAAQRLHLSQPALSKQLSELEGRLGFTLFRRTKRAMILTEPGKEFSAHANRILGSVATLEAQLVRYAKGKAGKLKIGIDGVHHGEWLPTVMKDFRMRHPDIELAIMRVPNLLSSLQKGEIELAIVGEAVEATGIKYIALHGDELMVVLPRGHKLCRQRHVLVQDLAGADFVYYFDLEQSYLQRRYLTPNRIRLGSFRHVQSIEAIIALVAAGEGISILPKRLLADAVRKRAIQMRPIGEDGFAFTWYAAVAGASDQPYLADFIDLLKR